MALCQSFIAAAIRLSEGSSARALPHRLERCGLCHS